MNPLPTPWVGRGGGRRSMSYKGFWRVTGAIFVVTLDDSATWVVSIFTTAGSTR